MIHLLRPPTLTCRPSCLCRLRCGPSPVSTPGLRQEVTRSQRDRQDSPDSQNDQEWTVSSSPSPSLLSLPSFTLHLPPTHPSLSVSGRTPFHPFVVPLTESSPRPSVVSVTIPTSDHSRPRNRPNLLRCLSPDFTPMTWSLVPTGLWEPSRTIISVSTGPGNRPAPPETFGRVWTGETPDGRTGVGTGRGRGTWSLRVWGTRNVTREGGSRRRGTSLPGPILGWVRQRRGR